MKTATPPRMALFAGTRKERRDDSDFGRRKLAKRFHCAFQPIECHEKPLTRATIPLYTPLTARLQGRYRVMNLTRRDLNRLRGNLTNAVGHPLKRLCQIKREVYRRDELAYFTNNVGANRL